MGIGKLHVFILCIFSSAAYASDFSQTLTQNPCAKQASQVLTQWKVQDHWSRAVGHKPNEQIFRAPTQAVGKWVEVAFNGSDVALRLFNEKAVLTTTFDKHCQSTAGLAAHKVKSSLSEKQRTYKVMHDQEIANLLEQKKSGVIFLWSPHKQISVEGLKQILQAGKDTKVPVYPVVDSDSDPKAVDRVVKELKLAKKDIYFLDSFDLQYRGFRLHHPSLIVFNDGKFTSQVRRGYEDAFVYKDYLKSHM